MENRTAILTSEEIAARARAIGVPLSHLATDAGLAPSTPYRWTAGGSNSRTLRAMQKVLEARERALLVSLIRLHPEAIAGNAA